MAFWGKVASFFGWEKVRARDAKGRYVADDPSTVANEAYKDGRTPKKKVSKKPAAKRGRGRPKGSKNKPK